jgi:hypothetical protein
MLEMVLKQFREIHLVMECRNWKPAMNINTVGTNNTIANNAINTITSAGIIWNYYCCRERQYFFEYN